MVAYQPRHPPRGGRAGDSLGGDGAGRGKGAGRGDEGVESNSRITATLGLVLLVVLAIEGATLLGVNRHLDLHVFVGMVAIPLVAFKIGSTFWRFARYYSGSPAYRQKGPPHLVMRVLGPVVVVLTVVMLASGVGLVLAPHALGGRLGFLHKASFVLWFAAMAVHVLGHILEVGRVAPRDWLRSSRSRASGASLRIWAVAGAIAVGCVLGALMMGPTAHYAGHRGHPDKPSITAGPR